MINLLAHLSGLRDWQRRGWSDNAPQFVKEAILRKYAVPGATWVETGTFMGKTTRFLSGLAPMVYTIEPAPKLFQRAVRKFAANDGVQVLNGTSETVMPDLLPKLSGDICFWLDGHYSAGQTYKGPVDCPVAGELAAIEANLTNFGNVSILIDDIRLFLDSNHTYEDYPSVNSLVDWGRKYGFEWRVEQDIFILRNWS